MGFFIDINIAFFSIPLFFISIFLLTRELYITQNEVILKKRGLFKLFNETEKTLFSDITEIHFVKSQFRPGNLFIGSFHHYSSDKRAYYVDKIILKMKNKKEYRIIRKLGSKSQFKKAFSILKQKLEK